MPKREVYEAHEAITEHLDARGSSSRLHHCITKLSQSLKTLGPSVS
jgi:hypothetical protein